MRFDWNLKVGVPSVIDSLVSLVPESLFAKPVAALQVAVKLSS